MITQKRKVLCILLKKHRGQAGDEYSFNTVDNNFGWNEQVIVKKSHDKSLTLDQRLVSDQCPPMLQIKNLEPVEKKWNQPKKPSFFMRKCFISRIFPHQ